MDYATARRSLRRRLAKIAARMRQRRIREKDTGPSASADTARVAVIIPVFNSMPYLKELLDSLEAQDLDPKLFEVVAVDDGSTDGGGKLLDAYAARLPNMRLIRQHNSGWPGKPRNVGIDASRSDYVFFCDSDDLLGPEALRRMIEFADAHEVDVLAPKLVGIGGRRVGAALFASTAIDAPLRTILATLSPQKMIRRELLEEHGLRFPEGRVRLEDGMLLTRCYLVSRRNSILADYDYYFIRTRQVGTNISSGRPEPESFTESVSTIARIIKEGHPDPAFADQLVLDLYRRKALRFYVPRRYRAMSADRQRRWVTAHAQFVRDHIPEELEADLGFPFLQRSRLVRNENAAGLLQLAKTEGQLTADCRATPPNPNGLELRFGLQPSAEFESVHLLVQSRGSGASLSLDLRPDGQEYVLDLPAQKFAGLEKVVADLFVQLEIDGVQGPLRRVLAPETGMPLELDGTRIYATVNGNLSIDRRR
ncbi:glycosyltransferase family 2 protein [Paeniglutamicibacter sp.]|uniref:glycosyltransferase family 2 protein n=1 Tax=Paeniglutamicibacter sp. TaxID=1934391 RepID=UPI003989C6CE